jgi:hypothetical protein
MECRVRNNQGMDGTLIVWCSEAECLCAMFERWMSLFILFIAFLLHCHMEKNLSFWGDLRKYGDRIAATLHTTCNEFKNHADCGG